MKKYYLFKSDKLNKQTEFQVEQLSEVPYSIVRKKSYLKHLPEPIDFECEINQYIKALLLGIDYLVREGYDVINISLGFYNENTKLQNVLEKLVFVGLEKKMFFIVAAGNKGPNKGSLQTLAKLPYVISVGATGNNKEPLSLSSRGNGKKYFPSFCSNGVIQPQEQEIIKKKRGKISFHSGTSFSAPRVAKIVCATKKMIQVIGVIIQNIKSKVIIEELRLPIFGLLDTSGELSLDFYPNFIREKIESKKLKFDIKISNHERLWILKLGNELSKVNGGFWITYNYKLLTDLLKEMAIKLDYSKNIIGYGYLDNNCMVDFFLNISPSIFIKHFTNIPLKRISADDIKKLDNKLGVLFTKNRIIYLMDYCLNGIIYIPVKIIA